MNDLLLQIEQVQKNSMDELLKAVLRRYGELYPDWDISIISLEKKKSKAEQIDEIVQILLRMKDN